MWFSGCKYAEDGKNLYRDLCRKYHPDNGWTGDELKQINVEFRQWWETHKHRYKENTENTSTTEKEVDINIEAFMEIINKLSVIPNISIDIVGCWLWLRGNTYPYKDYLKEIGCRWSCGKKMWYYTESPYTKYASHESYKQLKNKYGCQTVNPKGMIYIG